MGLIQIDPSQIAELGTQVATFGALGGGMADDIFELVAGVVLLVIEIIPLAAMNGVSGPVRTRIAAARAASIAINARWRASAEVRALEAAFEGCPAECPEVVAERAAQVLGDAGWAEALLAPQLEALRGDAFHEPPFRVTRDRARTAMVLFDCPAGDAGGVRDFGGRIAPA